jgi:hypothetical protein
MRHSSRLLLSTHMTATAARMTPRATPMPTPIPIPIFAGELRPLLGIDVVDAVLGADMVGLVVGLDVGLDAAVDVDVETPIVAASTTPCLF